MYREIKIRGAVLNGSELDLLPEEEVKQKVWIILYIYIYN